MAKADDCIKGFNRDQEQLGLELAHEIEGFERGLMITGKYTKDQARQIAQDAAISAKAADIARVRRQRALQIIAMNRTAQQVASHPDGKATGVMSLMVKDLGSRAGYSNADMRALTHLGRYHQHFAEGLEKMRTTLFGLRQDKKLARNVVRELFGEKSGSEQAQRAARAWSETAEIARKDFNRAGGAIPKRADWGLPQVHDSLRVGKVSREEWVDFTLSRVDPKKILDDTGRPMGDMQLRVTLDRVYDTIRTDGLSDSIRKGKGRGGGGGGMANRHRDHRFLVFKDADSWLEYMNRFGPEDIYATMTDHLHRMSQETALMEVMGPNPQATYRYLRDVATMDGMGQRSGWFLDTVFDELTGAINHAKWASLADFGKAVRNFLAASKLGAAFLSAISDFGFISQTAHFRGLPVMRVFRRQLSLLNPTNQADRLFAVRQGLTADAWITRALAANRYTEVTGSGITAKLADFTMRASGLSAWTDAGKKAFGMEMQAMIAENATRTFRELPKPIREMFNDYKITSDLWDTIRTGDSFIEHEGARFFSPDQMMRRADLEDGVKYEVATKIQEMILTETKNAVPEPDSRAMAIIHAGTQRGSVVGELWRGGMLFKTFPITALTNHLYRGALLKGPMNKAAYIAQITVSTTVLGALALQLKDISKGKDPRPMTDAKFWAAAYMQGGGAGIYGDFLFSDMNRFGQGPFKSFTTGPMGEFFDRSLQLTLGNVQQVVKGEDANIGGDLVNFMRGYSPGVSLWYTRLAYERAILDALDELSDETKARAKAGRRESRMIRDYNQRFWWQPGDLAPERPPDIGNIKETR